MIAFDWDFGGQGGILSLQHALCIARSCSAEFQPLTSMYPPPMDEQPIVYKHRQFSMDCDMHGTLHSCMAEFGLSSSNFHSIALPNKIRCPSQQIKQLHVSASFCPVLLQWDTVLQRPTGPNIRPASSSFEKNASNTGLEADQCKVKLAATATYLGHRSTCTCINQSSAHVRDSEFSHVFCWAAQRDCRKLEYSYGMESHERLVRWQQGAGGRRQ